MDERATSSSRRFRPGRLISRRVSRIIGLIAMVVLILFIAFLFLGQSDTAASATMEEVRAMLEPELGTADEQGLSAYRHVAAVLPGSWLIGGWEPVSALTDEEVAEACAGSRLEVAPDLSVMLVVGGETPAAIPGRLNALRGRLFSLDYDEAAFLAELYGIEAPAADDQIALDLRQNAHQVMVLTPRSNDVLVGYGVLGDAGVIVFIRCPQVAAAVLPVAQ